MRDERFEVSCDLRRAARLHRQRARAAPPYGRIELGQPAPKRIEIALLPDDVRVVLQLDGLAERKRHRRQA